MPELPEVETIVRGLRGDLVGRVVNGATVLWPRTVEPLSPEAFAVRLSGQRIEALDRRGKYIVLKLNRDYLLIHLRMTGRLYVALPDQVGEADRWLRVRIALDDGRELRFSDARKFGRMHLTAQPEQVLGDLGPEPLSETFTLDRFHRVLAGRRGAMKPLLVRQSFLAGIGNIYADEALWQAEIHPQRPAHTLTASEIERLYHAIRTVLGEGIDHEGASVNWYRKPDGSTGEQQDHFRVYGRRGKACPRCGQPIERITLGQRGTYFCPRCQR